MSDVSVADSVLPDVDTVAAAAPEVEAVENEAAEAAEDSESGSESSAEELARKRKTALRNRERQLSKARAENAALKERLAEFEKKMAEKVASLKPPEEKDYESYSELVRAQAVHDAKKEILAAEEASQKEQLQQQQLQALQMRTAEIQQVESDFAAVVGDYQQTVGQHAAAIHALPEQLKDMLRELDNPAAAVYVLAKEGRLQDLQYMNPYFAAVALMQAQERGEGFISNQRQQQPLQQTTKQAPEPMRGARGTAVSTSKPLHQMGAKELVSWLNQGE